jgi:hypothetical protein
MFIGADRPAAGFRVADRDAGRISGVLRRCAAVFVAAVLIALTLMLSAVLVAVFAILGGMSLCYLWWKSRRPQRQPFGPPPRGGLVLEGEVIREVSERDEPSR